MKKFLFACAAAVALLTGLSACKKEKAKPYQVNFINNTGAPIQEAVVDAVSLGDIEPGAQTGYTGLDELYEANGMADCAFSGKQAAATIESDRLVFCCSIQPQPLPHGKYDVIITLKTVGSRQYFDLRLKQ
jgi:hypothetical protein